MKRLIIFLLIVVSGKNLMAQDAMLKKDELYIYNHAKLAVIEMDLYKIPASITLAQGLLETGNGQSDLAQYGNNHFGIKCKGEWKGDKMYHDDDLRGECFRKYPSVQDSYRDHSLFLAERPYYKKLFLLDQKDYKAWAFGLKQAGYATNPKYAYILIKLIEKYKLNKFDYLTINEVETKLAELFPDVKIENVLENSAIVVAQSESKSVNSITTKTLTAKTNNLDISNSRIKYHPNGNIKYIEVKDGDTLEQIAQVYNITMQRLLIYNDLRPKSQLKVNQKIFLEPKKNYGLEKEYTVKEGETMYEIAQNNGVFLNQLYKSNSMFPGEEPQKGDKILLKGKKG